MGDPTSVRLLVLHRQLDAAQKHFAFEADESEVDGDLAELTFYEINYGDLPFREALKKVGIAYDSTWSSGAEFGPGTESLRFNAEGEPFTSTVYEADINPELNALMALIDKPDELRTYLLKHQEEVADRPWDNQEEYGKFYMAKQLINPT